MNRETLTKLAREAGLGEFFLFDQKLDAEHYEEECTALERFASLVLADQEVIPKTNLDLRIEAALDRLLPPLASQPNADARCKCSMRIKLVGDGCRYCNPHEYIDRLHEQMADDAKEIANQPVQAYAMAGMPGWLPIDSAPKDGTEILVTSNGYPFSTRSACWANYHPNSTGKESWRTQRTCGDKLNPTHWMQITTLPKATK